MKTNPFFTMLLGVGLVFVLCGQAQAVPMSYNVNAILSGGGLLTGSMEIDSGAGPFNYIAPTTWTFMSSGGVDPIGNPISNFTYNPISSNLIINFSALSLILTDVGTGRSLRFRDYNPLLNEPGPYSIGSIVETYKYSTSSQFFGQTFTYDKFAVRDGSGTVASVPEPASVLLLGSGLASLGALRFRKGKKA